jgi:phosphatidylserine decarboxylase
LVSKYTKSHGDLLPQSFFAKERVLAKNERISLIGVANEKFCTLTAVGSLCRGNIKLEKDQKDAKKELKDEEIDDYFVCAEKIGKFMAGSTVVVIAEVNADQEIVGVKTGAVLVGEEVARVVKRRNE